MPFWRGDRNEKGGVSIFGKFHKIVNFIEGNQSHLDNDAHDESSRAYNQLGFLNAKQRSSNIQ